MRSVQVHRTVQNLSVASCAGAIRCGCAAEMACAALPEQTEYACKWIWLFMMRHMAVDSRLVKLVMTCNSTRKQVYWWSSDGLGLFA